MKGVTFFHSRSAEAILPFVVMVYRILILYLRCLVGQLRMSHDPPQPAFKTLKNPKTGIPHYLIPV